MFFTSFCGVNMRVIIQVSRIQHRKNDDVFFVYLRKEYNGLWRKLKEKRIPVIVRIEIPDDDAVES